MTNLQDLESRLREWKAPFCIPVEGSVILEAADLIATLQKLGEGLPEPVKSVWGKMTDGWTCSVEATVDYFTREQMISYGMAQRGKQ